MKQKLIFPTIFQIFIFWKNFPTFLRIFLEKKVKKNKKLQIVQKHQNHAKKILDILTNFHLRNKMIPNFDVWPQDQTVQCSVALFFLHLSIKPEYTRLTC